MNYVSDNSKAANGFRLGRWNVPDPANQYPSPYVGMGNNSANRVAPDGKNVFNGLTYWFPIQFTEGEVLMENQRMYALMETMVLSWPKNAVEKTTDPYTHENDDIEATFALFKVKKCNLK